MLYTTLDLIRKQSPCSSRLNVLLTALGPKWPEGKEISLSKILKTNGFEDTIWALRATTVDARKIAAHLAIEFAYPVLPIFEKEYPEDKRPRKALEAASDFLDGKISLAELEAAAQEKILLKYLRRKAL